MLKAVILIFALCLVAFGQDPNTKPEPVVCRGLNADQCYGNISSCGFCTFNNQESACLPCESSPQCTGSTDAIWNGQCACHKDEKTCEAALTPIQPNTRPAQANCEWCAGSCINPLTSKSCCLKDVDACNESPNECFYCDREQICLPLAKKDKIDCDANSNDACNAVCTADYNPVCGSDGNTYSNLCELEKKRDCKMYGAGDLKKLHEGECCGDIDLENDCKGTDRCQFCNGKCLHKTATCGLFECLIAHSAERCEALKEKGCEWCEANGLCLNKEAKVKCEPKIDCGQIDDSKKCRSSKCFWCDAKSVCKNFEGLTDGTVKECTCYKAADDEGACGKLDGCRWCPNGKSCNSKEDFPKERCFFNVDPPTCLASTNLFGAACALKGAKDTKCEYCPREGVCIPADTTQRPAFCDCKTDDEKKCSELDGCHWCNNQCIVKTDRAEKCGNCFELEGDKCTGDCAICPTTGRCFPKNRIPDYCFCHKIDNQISCERAGNGIIRAACTWCTKDANSDEGECVRGVQCNPGQNVACSRGLEEEKCKTCISNRPWTFCDTVGCIPGEQCDKPDTCPDPNDSPVPIVECVRKLNTKIGVACLGANTPNSRVELKVGSARNTLTDAKIDNANLPSIFQPGRTRQYPACFFRVEFELTKKPRWCICDRCVDIDTTKACPAPKWRIVFKGIISDAELIEKLKLWFSLKFRNIDLEDIIINIIKGNSKRQTTTEAEISVSGDKVTDAEIEQIDNGLSDPSLGTAVGAEVQGVQTTGSGVSQQGSSQTASGSPANTIVVGLTLLFVAMLAALL